MFFLYSYGFAYAIKKAVTKYSLGLVGLYTRTKGNKFSHIFKCVELVS
jgi:hypothetical protein